MKTLLNTLKVNRVSDFKLEDIKQGYVVVTGDTGDMCHNFESGEIVTVDALPKGGRTTYSLKGDETRGFITYWVDRVDMKPYTGEDGKLIEKELAFKEGDIVKIVDNTEPWNCYKIGQRVVILEPCGDNSFNYDYKVKPVGEEDNDYEQNVSETQIVIDEPVQQEFKVGDIVKIICNTEPRVFYEIGQEVVIEDKWGNDDYDFRVKELTERGLTQGVMKSQIELVDRAEQEQCDEKLDIQEYKNMKETQTSVIVSSVEEIDYVLEKLHELGYEWRNGDNLLYDGSKPYNVSSFNENSTQLITVDAYGDVTWTNMSQMVEDGNLWFLAGRNLVQFKDMK